jgi:uncharacterized protein (UPF0335 family)
MTHMNEPKPEEITNMDATTGGVINRDALHDYVHRVAQLHNERDDLNESIREVYRESKEAGFDTTVLREIVREFRTDAEARQSRYALLDAYRTALGMLSDTPLGEAALHSAETTMARPRPFAEQPIKRGRGRPRKTAPLDLEWGSEPAGAA